MSKAKPRRGPPAKYPFVHMRLKEERYFGGVKTFTRARWAAIKVGAYHGRKFKSMADGRKGGWIWRVL